jgi:hypothetical protein
MCGRALLGPNAEELVYFSLKAIQVLNFSMLRCCNFGPSYSSYVTGISSGNYTDSSPSRKVPQRVMFPVMLCPCDIFTSLGPMLVYIPAERLLRKQI